jgi:hypothetical protein
MAIAIAVRQSVEEVELRTASVDGSPDILRQQIYCSPVAGNGGVLRRQLGKNIGLQAVHNIQRVALDFTPDGIIV